MLLEFVEFGFKFIHNFSWTILTFVTIMALEPSNKSKKSNKRQTTTTTTTNKQTNKQNQQ